MGARVCVYKRVCVFVYVYRCARVCIGVCVDVEVYACVYRCVCVFVYVYRCTRVCSGACVCV